MNHIFDEVADPSAPALIVSYGHTDRKYRPLKRDLILLGRSRACDIGLVSPEIADTHCIVLRTAAGWRVRDCGSRIGTRLNGKAVHEEMLCDGDVLQVGTFNFRVQLPLRAPEASAGAEARRLQRSRRGLARLALRLRRKLREERRKQGPGTVTPALAPCQVDLDQQMSVLRHQLRHCEERSQRLQAQERELARDRDALDQGFATLQTRMDQAEQTLAAHQREVETVLQRTREECEQRCRDVERSRPVLEEPEEARRLDLRCRELAHYAAYLRRTRQRLEDVQRRQLTEQGHIETDLAALREENDRLRHALEWWDHHPIHPTVACDEGTNGACQTELLRAQVAALRQENLEKEAQIQRLLTQRRQEDPSAAGMDMDSYEAQLAAYRRQLHEDRRGLNEEIQNLRERAVALDEAAHRMESQLIQERTQLAEERLELDRLRETLLQGVNQGDQSDGEADHPTVGQRLKEGLGRWGGLPQGPSLS